MVARTTARKAGTAGAALDSQRLADLVRSPGIDTRIWLAAGTVGTRDADGKFSTEKLVERGEAPAVPEAVYVDRLGPVVDVRLEPEGDLVTARWAGIGVGRFGQMLFPIRGGDDVIVAIPGGDLNSPDISIVAVMSNQTALVPEDWNNDRVLFNLNVPLEIRGPAVAISSPLLTLNGRLVGRSREGV